MGQSIGFLHVSKQLLPTTARLGDFARILCGCLAFAIVASLHPSLRSADTVTHQAARQGLSAKDKEPIPKPEEFRKTMTLGGAVANWRFSRSNDMDFDGWPEGWQRQTDRDHPPYLPIKMVATDPDLLSLSQAADSRLLQKWKDLRADYSALPALPPSIGDLLAGRYLRIELDGGWAMIQSPSIKVDPLYRYRLELSAKVESLVHDHAYAELVFFDSKNKAIAAYDTNKLTGTRKWRRLRSELTAVPKEAVSMTVRLILRPMKATGVSDIRGAAGFDDIAILRLPQMTVSTDQRLGLYATNDRPAISVRVTGLEFQSANINFLVRDKDRRIVAKHTSQFTAIAPAPDTLVNLPGLTNEQAPNSPSAPQPSVTGLKSGREQQYRASRVKDTSIPVAIDAVAKWQLPELPPGFYTIDCLLGNIEAPALTTETTFAILAKLPSVANDSPYGWTMPKSVAADFDTKKIPDWLERLGVRVFKCPCWLEPNDKAQLETAAWLVGRLQEKNIRTIGVLDKPPPSVLAKIDERERRDPYAANLFRDPAVWQPLLEPIMTRLSLKVRTWQLGSDSDFSFLGRPKLKETVKDISRNLQGFGQPIGVAISWPWLEPLPPPSDQSWEAIQLSSSTTLAADELDSYLESMESAKGALRPKTETWVTIDPLESSAYDRDVRIADLVMRMTAVRGHRVQATFVTDPASRTNGLLREDWRPGELLLPWRTTATLLADVTRLGTLSMPAGSENVVLANATRTLVVVWNPIQTTEKIYLGDSIRQFDVWGNAKTPKRMILDGKPVFEIDVGPVPTFLVDLDPILVAFRMSTRLGQEGIDSLLGRTQQVTIEFSNPTRESLNGEIRMNSLPDWKVDSRPQSFDLSPGRTATHSFDVSLRNSARIGEAQLEFDFLLRTQPQRRFSITRKLHVGPEGLDIDFNTRLVNDELVVFVTMTNRTSVESRYDCQIFPPGAREYQRQQITLPANATVKRVFPWPNGKDLIGQRMLFRANEQGGARMLNQVIELTP